jgi:hypothetical protein
VNAEYRQERKKLIILRKQYSFFVFNGKACTKERFGLVDCRIFSLQQQI